MDYIGKVTGMMTDGCVAGLWQ